MFRINPFARLRNRPHKTIRRDARLTLERLEGRETPAAAFDQHSIAVGFRTGDADDPVVARAVLLAEGQSVEQALAQWRQDPRVAYAEPNYTFGTDLMPNDTHAALLYGQNNTGQSGGTVDADMDAAEAWDLTTGSSRTVVAVIDTGVDYTHPDLYRNIWINQAEIPAAVRSALTDVDGDGLFTFWDLNDAANIGAGKIRDLNANGYIDGGDLLRPAGSGGWADGTDAGANGYVDDLIGWDFVGNDNNPMDVVAEDGGHGTHVAGTIGAVGNNGVGVTGVAWRVQMMPLRFLGVDGGTSVAAANAVRYSAANGAAISNNSWGGGAFSQAVHDAIAYARSKGQVFVAAAGNDTANNDTTASYPANYALDNIVTVAATDRYDRLAAFSNYGRSTVDLAAAGVDVASTYPGNRYVYMSGTSMATPQISGAFALLLSNEPSLGYSAAIGRVLNSVDPVAALGTTTITGGRLNVYGALTAATTDAADPSVTSMAPNPSGSNSVSSVRVSFSERVDAATFTPADVVITGPGGSVIAATGVVAVGTDGRQFDVKFASQSAVGTYTVRVGPNVADAVGHLMDQDRDGVAGEADQDQFAGTFTVAAAPVTTTFSNYTAVSIRDRYTVVSRITVGQDIKISDLNVVVNLTHTYTSDLAISLRGPDGTTVNLFYRRGGSGDHLTSTTFNDDAATAIAAGAAPFTGSFRPEKPLSAFDGKNARGTWELRITDHAYGDVGQLKNWSLKVTSGTPYTGLSAGRAIDVRPVEAPAAAAPQSAAPAGASDTALRLPLAPAGSPRRAAKDWAVYVGAQDAAKPAASTEFALPFRHRRTR